MYTLMKRYEKKYLLSKKQFEQFLSFISQHIDEDPNHINHEPYHVQSIYFDDEKHSLIRHSLSSPAYKEKLRLRTYNQASHFLELKKKFQGQSYKSRIPLTSNQKSCLLGGDMNIFNDSVKHKELKYMFMKYTLKPMLYVNYLRYAFEDTSIGLRITLDKELHYAYMNASKHSLFQNQYILEIKCHLAFPLWLVSYLSDHRLHHQSLSKYGHSYLSQLKGTQYVFNT